MKQFPQPGQYAAALPRVSDHQGGGPGAHREDPEFQITTKAADHPFHIHINPCWVTRIDVPDEQGRLHNILDAPCWMDTVSIPRGGRVVFRSRFADYTGYWVNHCHILMHEDHGMMQGVSAVARAEAGELQPEDTRRGSCDVCGRRQRDLSGAVARADVPAEYVLRRQQPRRGSGVSGLRAGVAEAVAFNLGCGLFRLHNRPPGCLEYPARRSATTSSGHCLVRAAWARSISPATPSSIATSRSSCCPPHWPIDPDRLRRFELEARSASALNHPAIVTIYDLGQAESQPYISMELVDGQTLRQMLRAGTLNAPARAAGGGPDRRRTGQGTRGGHRPSRSEA